MNVSKSIGARGQGHNRTKKAEPEERASSAPATALSKPQSEQVALRDSSREKNEGKVQNTAHINALQEAYGMLDSSAQDNGSAKLKKSGDDDGEKKAKVNNGKAYGKIKKSDDDDDDDGLGKVARSGGDQDDQGEQEDSQVRVPAHSKKKVKGKGHSKGKGKAKGHSKGKAKGHSKGKAPSHAKGKAKGHAKGKAKGHAKGKAKAEEHSKSKLKKSEGEKEAKDSLKSAIGKLKETDGDDDAQGKVNDAIGKLKKSGGNEDAQSKLNDSLGKLKDKEPPGLAKKSADDDDAPGKSKNPGPKNETPQDRPKEVVRTEARVHTRRSVESRQEANRLGQRSIGQSEVVQKRTSAIRQSAPIGPRTSAPPKIEQPRINERERKPDVADIKPQKLRDRKPLKLSARPDEQKAENLPLATRGETQTRVQLSSEDGERAVDRELQAQDEVGRKNGLALQRSESMTPKTTERGLKIEKAQTSTRSDSSKESEKLSKGQTQLTEDQKSAVRAEETQGEAKQSVIDSNQRVNDGESEIMTRERQIHEATGAVSESKLENLEAAGMAKTANLRLDDALHRFHQGKFEEDKGDDADGKTKEERDAVLSRAVTSAQEFQDQAQARVKVAKQRDVDAKKGVTVATDRLGQDQKDLRKSETHLETHRENETITQADLATARKNVDTEQLGVEDRHGLLSKLKLRENSLGREADHNEDVLNHLTESKEPLTENIRNQQENAERLRVQRQRNGLPRTLDLREMLEVPTPRTLAKGNTGTPLDS
jgi:hypothetical protein